MVRYNNERQQTTEIGFLKNESQTMITFVSNHKHATMLFSLHTLTFEVIN